MNENTLNELSKRGQSVWLDYIRRDMLENGTLKKMIEEDDVKGITSNPSIFEMAIAESSIYDSEIQKLAHRKKDKIAVYEAITQQDVQTAADEFLPIYKQTNAHDGFVSLEVNPHLAHNTIGTIEEARRLWLTLNRQNILIKVPATIEGLSAVRQLISEGINVNVTLLFCLTRYKEVAEAYIAGLEDRVSQGKSLHNIASVASFFLSRIDSAVDPKEIEYVGNGGDKAHFDNNIRGQVAISSAKMAYKLYMEIFGNDRFLKLVHLGAKPQRLLWASTKTKNLEYSDVKYVDALIGRNTINTIPLETLEAYLDHGKPANSLDDHLEKASLVISELPDFGIDLKVITTTLENEGIEKFIVAYDTLLKVIQEKIAQK
jgi:transaldolase